jgi:hypothetical protein
VIGIRGKKEEQGRKKRDRKKGEEGRRKAGRKEIG